MNIDISKFLPQLSDLDIKKKIESSILLQMLVEGNHADITFKAQGGLVKAHRCFLATVSPVFGAMFKHPMKEQLTSIVDLSSMDIEAVKLFLVLLYSTDNKSDEKQEFFMAVDEHFDDFYEACCMYQVGNRSGLIIRNAMRRNLTPENCWYFHKKVNMESLKCICEDYILDNFEEVIDSDQIICAMKDDPEVVRDFVVLNHHNLKREMEEIRGASRKRKKIRINMDD
ncbi:hypothetical protein M758_12G143200 [Ceratodon purpureus]|nr:hypothetical protein M758_12G143200 [Ceratodon purpureus]